MRRSEAQAQTGVARSASPIGRSLNRSPAKHFGRTPIEASPCRARASRHPGAPACWLSRHPSSARRGILRDVCYTS